MKKLEAVKENKKNILFAWLGLTIILFLLSSVSTLAFQRLDLNLDKCIEIALEKNLGYQISQSSVEVKEAQFKEAEGAKKTNVKLKAGYIQMNEAPDPESIIEGDFSYLFSTGQGIPQISVSISKVLYSGGKFETLVDQAEADKQISLNELEGKAQEIVFQVTQAYYGVLQA